MRRLNSWALGAAFVLGMAVRGAPAGMVPEPSDEPLKDVLAVVEGWVKEHPKAVDIVLEGYQEHHVVDLLMGELDTTPFDDETWSAKAKVMKENIEHHIEEEEGEWFPKVREGLGRKQLQCNPATEPPMPGMGSVQATFFFSPQTVGSLVSLEMPVLSGPRHCGQLSARTGSAVESSKHRHAANSSARAAESSACGDRSPDRGCRGGLPADPP